MMSKLAYVHPEARLGADVTVEPFACIAADVVIGDGCATITDADCPDRLCVQRGRIDRSGQTVVCLPHGVVVTVRGGAESGVDN